MSSTGFGEYLYEVVTGKRQGWTVLPVLFLLGFFEGIYRTLLVLVRHFTKQAKLPVPVISIGNIVAGGTGKTPTAVAFAKILTGMGKHPAVLTRGYSGNLQETGIIFQDRDLQRLTPEATGDEPFLMAQLLPGVPIVVGRDRVVMARQALAAYPEIDVLLLDDGFQYWKLDRDLDVVLLDALQPFANGHVIPRGLLREPLTALRRADLIVLTRWTQVNEEINQQLIAKLHRIAPQLPIIRAETDNSTFTPLFSGSNQAGFPDRGKPAALITAIGNPEQFKTAVRKTGLTIGLDQTFPDHHYWAEAEICEFINSLKSSGIQNFVTTAKDGVKLAKYEGYFRKAGISGYILGLEFKFPQDLSILSMIQKER